MEEPAPKGIVLVDQDNRKVETEIASNATKMGVPTTRQNVSPDLSHLLEGMKEVGGEILHDTHAYAKTSLVELAGGKGGSTRDRVASKNPISLVWERINRKRDKPTLEKAA